MTRLLALALALLLATPAAAHALRVFARTSGGEVTGYAFFVGGGRPRGATWMAEMDGAGVASGRTGADGSFAFAVPDPVTGAIVITVDVGDGHAAAATLDGERFETSPARADARAPGGGDAAAMDRLVRDAVASEVAPVLDRLERMDARIRLTDALSGAFLIVGLAGALLWVRSRRR